MTPHTLRRMFASILAVCDVPPRRAMYLMGHTDPTLTLAVYQQVLDMGQGSVELLEQTLGCTLAAARAVYDGEGTAAEILGANTRTGPGAVSGTQSVQMNHERARGEPGFRSESGTELPESSIVCVIRRRSNPHERFQFRQGLRDKRLKGLEPSTFCMANGTAKGRRRFDFYPANRG